MITVTKREALLKKLSTYQFAAHDLQLYLDTHPGDEETLKQMRKFQKTAQPLKEQYEKQYGALTKRNGEGNSWDWIKSPWPWDNGEER